MDLNIKNYKVCPLTMVFLKNGDQILVLRRAANKQIFPNKLSGFGGKVEPGEEIEASAKREFTEETGLQIQNLTLKGSFTIFMTDTDYLNILYIYVVTRFSGDLKTECDEGSLSWMPITEFLHHLDRVDHIGYYLEQVLSDHTNFYSGVAIRQNGVIVEYNDNSGHFKDRAK